MTTPANTPYPKPEDCPGQDNRPLTESEYEGVVTWDQLVDEFEANWDERQATA